MGEVPLKVLLVMVGGAGVLRITSRKEAHFAKADPPIFFSAVDSSAVVSMIHPAKAELPIVVTATGTLMLVSDAQFSKALSPIDRRATGRVIPLRAEQPWKALLPIFLTEVGRLITRKFWHFLNTSLSTSVIKPLTATLSRLVQFSKALEPILFTMFGMLTSLKEAQFSKAWSPIFVRAVGSAICDRLLQSSKA